MVIHAEALGDDRWKIDAPPAHDPIRLRDELACLIDWLPLARELDGIHSARKGEPAWPPLALFKALLIAVWHDLSDVKLAEALDDRASTPATTTRTSELSIGASAIHFSQAARSQH